MAEAQSTEEVDTHDVVAQNVIPADTEVVKSMFPKLTPATVTEVPVVRTAFPWPTIDARGADEERRLW